MDIPLPRDLEELVRREVEAGAYESASEMVVEALGNGVMGNGVRNFF